MASRGEVARARAGERRAHALVLLSEEGDDRRQRGGGLGRLLAGPASWAAQGRGGPGKSLLPFISVFFFNFLTFV